MLLKSWTWGAKDADCSREKVWAELGAKRGWSCTRSSRAASCEERHDGTDCEVSNAARSVCVAAEKRRPCLRCGHLEVVQVGAARAAVESDHGGLEGVVLVIGHVGLAGVDLSRRATRTSPEKSSFTDLLLSYTQPTYPLNVAFSLQWNVFLL